VTNWDRFFDEHYLRTYMPRLDKVDSSAEALAAVELAGAPPNADVLDCPCGWGRHTIPLADAGYRAVGTDRSAALLDEARRRREDATWVQADYRELPFADGSFDCVLNLFSSIGYVGEEGDRQAFSEFHRVLRPGGSLVVETMHRDRLARIYQTHSWDQIGADGLLVEARSFDQVASVTSVDHTYIGPNGSRDSFSYEFRVYTVTEVDRLLRDAGFAEVQHYGGLGGEELTLDTRLVAVARR
jgi:ubiquinone/menaquinone biosynthesis C-methylase UbiE